MRESLRQPGKSHSLVDLPVFRVILDIKRIADTCGHGRYPIRPRKLQVEDIVHWSKEDHIGINQDDTFIFDETEYSKLRPNILETLETGVETGMLTEGRV